MSKANTPKTPKASKATKTPHFPNTSKVAAESPVPKKAKMSNMAKSITPHYKSGGQVRAGIPKAPSKK